MRRALLLLALGLLLSGGPGLSAAPGWSWSTALDTTVGFGDTRYLMEEPLIYGTYGVSSELIFPLNALLEGISFRGEKIGTRRDGGRSWGFEVSLAVSQAKPFGVMSDSDWWIYPAAPRRLWSFTESDVTMTWFTLAAAWRMPMVSGKWGSLAGVLGYRLQYVYQKANGYHGWHTDEFPPYDDIPDGFFTDSSTALALTYWVLWNVATAGLGVTLQPAPRMAVGLEGGLAVPYVADEDDHVLRHKLSTAAGLGLGAYANLSARYTWGMAEARVHPYVSLAGSLLYLKANTRQTQTYYTGATEYPPGTTASGIDHQISTRQFSATLACGISF